MVFEIKKAKNGDKELYVYDQFVASWDAKVNDMEVIVPAAIYAAREQGKNLKQIEMQKVLGL